MRPIRNLPLKAAKHLTTPSELAARAITSCRENKAQTPPVCPGTSPTPPFSSSLSDPAEDVQGNPLARLLYHANSSPGFTPDLPALTLVHDNRVSLESHSTVEDFGALVLPRLHEMDSAHLVRLKFCQERRYEFLTSAVALVLGKYIDVQVCWIVLK